MKRAWIVNCLKGPALFFDQTHAEEYAGKYHGIVDGIMVEDYVTKLKEVVYVEAPYDSYYLGPEGETPIDRIEQLYPQSSTTETLCETER